MNDNDVSLNAAKLGCIYSISSDGNPYNSWTGNSSGGINDGAQWFTGVIMPNMSNTDSDYMHKTLIYVENKQYVGLFEYLSQKISKVLTIKKSGSRIGIFVARKLVAVFDFNNIRECSDKELSF